MRFGVMLSVASEVSPARAPQVYREALTQVVLAESLGYESVWVAEHHFTSYVMLPAPLLFLSLSQRPSATR